MLMLPSAVPVVTLYFLEILFLCDAAFTRHRRPFLASPRGRVFGGSHSRVFSGHRGNFGRGVNGGFRRSLQPLREGSRKIQPRVELGKKFRPRYQEALRSHGYDLGRYRGGGSREWNQHHQTLDTSTRRGDFHDPRYRGDLDHRWDRGNHDSRYRESQNRKWSQFEGRNTARGSSRGSAEAGYRGNLHNNFFATPLRNGYWSRYGRYYGPGFFGSRYGRIGFGGAYYPGLGMDPAIGESNRTSSEFNTGRDPSSRNLGRDLEQSSLRGSGLFFSGNAREQGSAMGRDRTIDFAKGGGEAGKIAERNRFGNFPMRERGFIIERGRNLNTVEEIRIGGRGGTAVIERERNENLSARAEETVPKDNSGNFVEGEREESRERGKTGRLVDRGSNENFPESAGKSATERSRSGNILDRARGAANGIENPRKPLEEGAKRGEAGSLVDRERSRNFPERSQESLFETGPSRNPAKEGIEMKKNGAGSAEKDQSGNPGGTGIVVEKDRFGNLILGGRVANERNRFGSFIERRGGGNAFENDRSENPVGEREAGMERSRSENIPGREANVAEAHRFENSADFERLKESTVQRVQLGNSAGEGRLKTKGRSSFENVVAGREGKAVLEGSIGFSGRGFYDGFYDDFMRYSILGGMFSGVSDMAGMAASLGAGAVQSQIMQNSHSDQLTQDIQIQQNTTRKSNSCVATFAYMARNGSPVYKCECSGEISYQYNRCVAPGG